MMIIKGIDKRVGLIFYGDTVPEPLGSQPTDSRSLQLISSRPLTLQLRENHRASLKSAFGTAS